MRSIPLKVTADQGWNETVNREKADFTYGGSSVISSLRWSTGSKCRMGWMVLARPRWVALAADREHAFCTMGSKSKEKKKSKCRANLVSSHGNFDGPGYCCERCKSRLAILQFSPLWERATVKEKEVKVSTRHLRRAWPAAESHVPTPTPRPFLSPEV